MRFSRTLALVLGVLVPIAETVRRWNTWRDAPMALFDDYILGALALYGAWLAGRDFRRGQCFLAAVWGMEQSAPGDCQWLYDAAGVHCQVGER